MSYYFGTATIVKIVNKQDLIPYTYKFLRYVNFEDSAILRLYYQGASPLKIPGFYEHSLTKILCIHVTLSLIKGQDQKVYVFVDMPFYLWSDVLKLPQNPLFGPNRMS